MKGSNEKTKAFLFMIAQGCEDGFFKPLEQWTMKELVAKFNEFWGFPQKGDHTGTENYLKSLIKEVTKTKNSSS